MLRSGPRRKGRRSRGDQGSSILEVALAIALMAMLAGVTVRHIASSQRTTLQTRVQDEAVAIAYDHLERARAFGCGLETGTEPDLADRADRCGGLGVYQATVAGEVIDDYLVGIDTAWALSDSTTRPDSCAAFTTLNPRPNMLIRTLNVAWGLRGQERSIESFTVEALPGDAVPFASEVRGAVVVQVDDPDDRVGLIVDGQEIVRPAVEYGSDLCVWLPFVLPPDGPLSMFLSMPGGATHQLNPGEVVSGETVCFDEAKNSC